MSIFDRFFGPPNVEKLRARGDVKGLLRALEYNRGKREVKRQIRREAVDALAEIGEAALQPAVDRYLDPRRKTGDKPLLLALREIGKRAEDPAVRLRLAEKLGDLLDLRKEKRAAALRVLFSLACRPNLPTFIPVAQAIFTPWLVDPSPAIRIEATLGMLVISLPGRNYSAIHGWYDQVLAGSREDPQSARRTAAAMAEAAPLLQGGSAQSVGAQQMGGENLRYFSEKTVEMLLSLGQKWKDHPRIRESIISALAAYPRCAVPHLLERLEESSADAFARETLEEIGRRMMGTPQHSAFVEMLAPSLSHQDWGVRGVVAQVLQIVGYEPDSMLTRADLLVAARNFNFSSWSEIDINRELVERMAATVDDPRYPAPSELVRHLSMLHAQISDREARFRLRGVLVRCLETQSMQVKMYIVRGLAALDWQPSSGAGAVIFWIYTGEWERASAVASASLPGDAAGVDALIESLAAPDTAARKTAARALGSIYQSETVDGPTRARIRAASIRMEDLLGPIEPGSGGSDALII